MLTAEAEFNKRNVEIEEYLRYLEALEAGVAASVTLMNTMKSSALLMLYNQIESTMSNVLQDIFDHFEHHRIAFDALSKSMRALVLSYSKRRNPKVLVERMDARSINLVVACFDRSDLFAGNIDCKRIRDVLTELGISSRHRYTEAALKDVKEKRNDLAHGNASFSECGKSYTTKQLKEFHQKTTVVLRHVIEDVDNFITDKSYR